MRCTKCLCSLALCTCIAVVGTYITAKSDAVGCDQPSKIVAPVWCTLPPMDMPHDEPGQMPGPPLPNVTMAVSTSSASVSSSFTLVRYPSTST
jgi:hypothetical protein